MPTQAANGVLENLFASLLLLLWLVAISPPASALLAIEINEGVEGALPIAIVPFSYSGPGEAATDAAALIGEDLGKSGYFTVMPRDQLSERPTLGEEIRYPLWKAQGVDTLLIGRISAVGGELRVAYQLIDLLKEQRLLDDEITVAPSQLRRALHRVSDRVFENLTHQPGAFATRVAYVAEQAGRYRLRIADIDGHAPRTLFQSNQPIMSPAWSPDGEQLAYVSFEGGRPGIVIQQVRSGERQLVARYFGVNGAPAWSPDGERLALTLSKDGNLEIYLLEIASLELTRLTRAPAIDTEPVWSPNGDALMLTSNRSGRPQIYRLSLQGGAPRRLTFDGDYNTAPAVSPDGRQLAMVHRDRDQYRIGLLDLKYDLFRLLSKGQLDESPSFAPNGLMLLYSNGRGQLEVVTLHGVRHRIPLSDGDLRDPAWSPN